MSFGSNLGSRHAITMQYDPITQFVAYRCRCGEKGTEWRPTVEMARADGQVHVNMVTRPSDSSYT